MIHQLTPTQQLALAIKLASDGHCDQFDKGGSPYILHPLKVMHYVEWTGDYEIMAIAVLHDYIEDCGKKGATYKLLETSGFSQRVVEGVRCLTRVPGETEEEYQAKVLSNPLSIIVKMADLRHNSDLRRLKGITPKDLKRVEKYHTFYMVLKKKHDENAHSY